MDAPKTHFCTICDVLLLVRRRPIVRERLYSRECVCHFLLFGAATHLIRRVCGSAVFLVVAPTGPHLENPEDRTVFERVFEQQSKLKHITRD